MSGYVMEIFTTLYGGIRRYKNEKSSRYFGMKLIPQTTTQRSKIRQHEGKGTRGHAGKRRQDGASAKSRNSQGLNQRSTY